MVTFYGGHLKVFQILCVTETITTCPHGQKNLTGREQGDQGPRPFWPRIIHSHIQNYEKGILLFPTPYICHEPHHSDKGGKRQAGSQRQQRLLGNTVILCTFVCPDCSSGTIFTAA